MNKIIGKISDAGLKIETTLSNKALGIETSILGAGPRGPRGPQGPPGTTDYMALINLPSIESVTLFNDKTFEDLGLSAMTPNEIENLM